MQPSHFTLLVAVFWSAVTIGMYCVAKLVCRQWPRPWMTPLSLTPLALIAATILLHTSYRAYISGTHWLVAMLGPATVAFAIPIYERRALIRRQWPVLVVGVVVGSLTAMITAWAFGSLLGLSADLRLSLLPRSMSTPFAISVSSDIGGTPDLTAVFVVVTGVFGAILGDFMLDRMKLRSRLARGALLGMGAHGAGVAKANQMGPEEGSIAGIVMVIVGLLNVLVAPILARVLS